MISHRGHRGRVIPANAGIQSKKFAFTPAVILANAGIQWIK